MNSTPLWAIQVAVRNKLLTALNGDVSGIFDGPPETEDMPYVTVGEAMETPDNTHSTFGSQAVITLHIWTRERSHGPGLAIAEKVMAALDHQTLTVDGRHTVSVRHEFTQTLRDPDPEVRHIPVRFRVTTQEE